MKYISTRSGICQWHKLTRDKSDPTLVLIGNSFYKGIPLLTSTICFGGGPRRLSFQTYGAPPRIYVQFTLLGWLPTKAKEPTLPPTDFSGGPRRLSFQTYGASSPDFCTVYSARVVADQG